MLGATKARTKRQLDTRLVPSIPSKQEVVTQLKDRFIKWGIDSLTDHEVIQLLLSLGSPRDGHENDATQCAKQFGSLRGLLEASPEELQESGIAPEAVLLIRLVSEIPARILKQRVADKPLYQSSQEVFEYLYYSMRGLRNEMFRVIHLDRRNRIIDMRDLFKGTVDNIPIIPREIVESAIKCRAVSVIYAHNHPSGDPAPSKSDKQLTRDLVFIGNVIQIKVLDHIIIGDNSYFSFADEGLIEKYEDSFLTLRMRAGT